MALAYMGGCEAPVPASSGLVCLDIAFSRKAVYHTSLALMNQCGFDCLTKLSLTGIFLQRRMEE